MLGSLTGGTRHTYGHFRNLLICVWVAAVCLSTQVSANQHLGHRAQLPWGKRGVTPLVDDQLSTGASGGNLKTCYCVEQGCANKTDGVFLNNTNIKPKHGFKVCTELPGLDEVCQYDGRLFATTIEKAPCEFEDENSSISTKWCTDVDPVCDFRSATAPPPLPDNSHGTSSAGPVGTSSSGPVATAPPSLPDNSHGTSTAGPVATASPSQRDTIVGVVAAAVLILAIIGIPCYCYLKKKSNRRRHLFLGACYRVVKTAV